MPAEGELPRAAQGRAVSADAREGSPFRENDGRVPAGGFSESSASSSCTHRGLHEGNGAGRRRVWAPPP